MDDVGDSEVDDGTSNSSHDDSCYYHPLTNKQKQTVQYKEFFEVHSSNIEGLVTGIVMEIISRLLCFEYCDKHSGETNYIVSKYSVKNCKLLPIFENDDGDGGLTMTMK